MTVNEKDIQDATVEMLRRWADQLEKGEARVANIEQRVDTGYHEGALAKRFFFRKNPLMISLHLDLKTFEEEEQQAIFKALTDRTNFP